MTGKKGTKKSSQKNVMDGTNTIPEEEESYEIDAILDERMMRGHKEYFVHWKGYEDSENSWVIAKNMSCPELLKEYKARKSKRAISEGSVSSSLARESSTSNSQRRETFLLTGTPSTSNADCTTEPTKDSENADDISDEFHILGKDENPFEQGLTPDSILAFVLMGEKKFAAVVFKEDYTPYLIDNDVAKEYILDLILAATLTVPTYNMIPREEVQPDERKSEGHTERQEEDVNMEPI